LTRIAIVASSPVERAGLESIVRSADLEVVLTTATIAELVAEMDARDPDALLVALDTTDDDVPGEILGLASSASAPPIALLASGTGTAWFADALRGGVRAVLPRDAGEREIVGALIAISSGLVAVRQDFVDALANEAVSMERAAGAVPITPLTPRELDVLRMLAEGLGNKTISSRLGISEHTVKFHLASVFAKLHAGSRTEAVTQGVRQGLILL